MPGSLTLGGQARSVKVKVTLTEGRYAGETTVKRTNFGIKPPGKPGIRARDKVELKFDMCGGIVRRKADK
jgi:polyisoprenoid-binding protein YceI